MKAPRNWVTKKGAKRFSLRSPNCPLMLGSQRKGGGSLKTAGEKEWPCQRKQALEGKVEEQRIVLAQDVEIMNGCLGQQARRGPAPPVEVSGTTPGSGVVGTVQQAVMQVAAFEQGPDASPAGGLRWLIAEMSPCSKSLGARLGHQFAGRDRNLHANLASRRRHHRRARRSARPPP